MNKLSAAGIVLLACISLSASPQPKRTQPSADTSKRIEAPASVKSAPAPADAHPAVSPVVSNLSLFTIQPVVCNAQNCDYRAADDPNSPQYYDIDVPNLAPNQELLSVTYEPIHNVGALNTFAFLRVFRGDAKHIRLGVATYGHVSTALRIDIKALIITR